MPRFYIHLRNDLDVPDQEGAEFENLETARVHAINMVRFEVAEAVRVDGRIVISLRIDVEDEQRRIVDTVRFRNSVEVEL